MILVEVVDKQFGKKYIDFFVKNDNGNIIEKKKFYDWSKVSEETFSIINEHGADNVRIKHR